jgi:hypothetical protein
VIGPDMPQRQPWVNLERIRASSAKDVHERGQDDRPSWERSRHGTMAAAKAAVTKRQAFSTLAEFDRMAG